MLVLDLTSFPENTATALAGKLQKALSEIRVKVVEGAKILVQFAPEHAGKVTSFPQIVSVNDALIPIEQVPAEERERLWC